MSRVRSPNYPAMSLSDAISRIRDVYKAQQTTPEPREVVMKHMGYTSANGRAMKSLSALIKYGLLEDSGDEGLRVSDLAISILYPDPDDPSSKDEAIREAAFAPALFAEIFDRWEDRPSETSLEAFLIRKGFNANSIGNVTRSFYGTFDLVNELQDSYDSAGSEPVNVRDMDEEDAEVNQATSGSEQATAKPQLPAQELNSTKPVFDFESVSISTKIDNRQDLEELMARLEQIKAMLPDKTQH